MQAKKKKFNAALAPAITVYKASQNFKKNAS
jgi:hypothetical protein